MEDGRKSGLRFSKWERRIFPGWLFEPGNEEYRRITTIAYPTALIAVVALIVIGGLRIVQHAYVNGFADLSMALVLAGIVMVHRRTKRHHHNVPSLLGVLAYGIFCIYQIFAGSEKATYLWSYTFPLIVFPLLGSRLGTIAVTLFLLPVSVLLVLDPSLSFIASYPPGFSFSFIPSLLVVSGLSYLYERNREKNQQQLNRTNTALRRSNEEMERQVSERTGELTRSEEKYRNILENIDEMCFEVDLAGNITFFNEATCRLSGYSPSEALGMNYRQYTSPETAKSLKASFNRIYLTGEKGSLRDFEMIRKDKSVRDLEISFNLVRNPAGEAVGFRSIARDVTERKRADAAKRRSEERFSAAFRNSPAWITIIHMQSLKYLEVNEAWERLTGYTRAEAIGRTPIELRIYDQETWSGILEEIRANHTVKNKELIFPQQERRKFHAAGFARDRDD